MSRGKKAEQEVLITPRNPKSGEQSTLPLNLQIDTPICGLNSLVLFVYRILVLITLIITFTIDPVSKLDFLLFFERFKFFTYYNFYLATFIMAILAFLPTNNNSWIARIKIDLLTCSAGLELFLALFYWIKLHTPSETWISAGINVMIHGGVFVLLFIDFCLNRA